MNETLSKPSPSHLCSSSEPKPVLLPSSPTCPSPRPSYLIFQRLLSWNKGKQIYHSLSFLWNDYHLHNLQFRKLPPGDDTPLLQTQQWYLCKSESKHQHLFYKPVGSGIISKSVSAPLCFSSTFEREFTSLIIRKEVYLKYFKVITI